MLSVFFGLRVGHCNDLNTQLEAFDESVPKELLPVADDPGGNLICVGIAREAEGAFTSGRYDPIRFQILTASPQPIPLLIAGMIS